jgi:hypothetical protein
MRLNNNLILAGVLLIVLLSPLRVTAGEQWQFEDAQRIVAFSDVHGDYEAMVATLQGAGIVDEALSWSGGGTHLVIVGDILDRGPDSRAAMDLLMGLEDEAQAAGGMVHVLIGNHEVMNIIGDLRYVHAGEYASFAADELAEDRDRWFAAWLKERQLPGQELAEARAQFDNAYPAGYFAHRLAFAPDGQYGKWLLQKPMVVVINGNAFVHGGLPPSVADSGLQGVNGELMGDVRTYAQQLQRLIEEGVLLPTDPNRKHPDILERVNPSQLAGPTVIEAVADINRLNDALFSYQSPHWYRGHTYCSELIEGDRIAPALDKIGATRVFVGHTPTPTREVIQRLDGRVIEIDTGMNSGYYKGSGHAVVIEGEEISVLNEDGSSGIPPTASARRVGARPISGVSVEEIENLLAFGEITEHEENGSDVLEVSLDGRTLGVRFIKAKRSDLHPEVAAYRLDRLLKLDMVPVTVVREFDGKPGALQFVPVKRMDEAQRQMQKAGGGAWCPLPEQWTSMMIFDTLIANDARSADTIFYDLTNWQLMLVGYNSAFSLSTAKSTRFKDGKIRIGRSWQEALKSIDTDTLEATLGDVLDKRRIRALAKRRDLLLSQ